jgi:AcrR family transcriptional regulator
MAKQRTRSRVLDAARQLFAERGYEAATIRDIAAAAGLSTGAVFASFKDKAELFNEVIIVQGEAMSKALETADPKGSTHDALLEIFGLGYRLHEEHLGLMQAALGFSWLRDEAAERRARDGFSAVFAQVEQVLRHSIARGELSQNTDLRLVSGMLWASYDANYRQAIYDGWDVTALQTRMSDQIRLLLAGAGATA